MLGQQYDSMDCKPYSTAKYYEAYRPDIPVYRDGGSGREIGEGVRAIAN